METEILNHLTMNMQITAPYTQPIGAMYAQALAIPAQHSQAEPQGEPAPTLGELVAAYWAERESGGLAPKTWQQLTQVLGRLRDDVGSGKAITAVSRAVLLKWRDTAYGAAKQSSANTYLSIVCSFFKWIDQTQEVKGFKNPAVRIRFIAGKGARMAHEERERWTDAELVELLRLDNWLITLGVYTGARINEVAQLHKADITFPEGQPFAVVDINCNAPNKRLKTRAAARVVPLAFPPELMGRFKAFLAGFPDDTERVFPQLKYREIDGYASSAGRAVEKALASVNPRKTYHCLRHAFADRCKQRRVDVHITKELLGHSLDDITASRYGKRYTPEVLHETLMKAGVWDFS
jgi:integrase